MSEYAGITVWSISGCKLKLVVRFVPFILFLFIEMWLYIAYFVYCPYKKL